MKKSFSGQRKILAVCSALALLMLLSSISMAQEKTDEELKKKYAPILGEYEFDLSGFGGGVIILKFHIEGGELWGDSGDGKPITLEPVEDGEFEFTSVDPDSGNLEIKFIKNEEGEYTVCHIELLDMGVEVDGNRIK